MREGKIEFILLCHAILPRARQEPSRPLNPVALNAELTNWKQKSRPDHNKYQRQRWRGKLKGKEERGVRPRQRINTDKKAEEGRERVGQGTQEMAGRLGGRDRKPGRVPKHCHPQGETGPCAHTHRPHIKSKMQRKRDLERLPQQQVERKEKTNNFPPRPQIIFLWSYCSLVDFSDKVIKPVAFSLPEALVQKFTL